MLSIFINEGSNEGMNSDFDPLLLQRKIRKYFPNSALGMYVGIVSSFKYVY